MSALTSGNVIDGEVVDGFRVVGDRAFAYRIAWQASLPFAGGVGLFGVSLLDRWPHTGLAVIVVGGLALVAGLVCAVRASRLWPTARVVSAGQRVSR